MLTPRQQALNDLIEQLSAACQLKDWHSLLETVKVPPDVAPAFLTMRSELLAAAQPRELTKDECASLYHLLRVLMETNMALSTHAQELAHLVDAWMQQFAGLRGVARQIEHFAHFRKFGETEE